MSLFLRLLVTIALGALWTVGVASWFAFIVYGFKAVLHPRPGVRLWSRATLWNPTNVLLRPELLTEEGRCYRSRCHRALLVFLASITSFLLVRTITSALK